MLFLWLWYPAYSGSAARALGHVLDLPGCQPPATEDIKDKFVLDMFTADAATVRQLWKQFEMTEAEAADVVKMAEADTAVLATQADLAKAFPNYDYFPFIKYAALCTANTTLRGPFRIPELACESTCPMSAKASASFRTYYTSIARSGCVRRLIAWPTKGARGRLCPPWAPDASASWRRSSTRGCLRPGTSQATSPTRSARPMPRTATTRRARSLPPTGSGPTRRWQCSWHGLQALGAKTCRTRHGRRHCRGGEPQPGRVRDHPGSSRAGGYSGGTMRDSTAAMSAAAQDVEWSWIIRWKYATWVGVVRPAAAAAVPSRAGGLVADIKGRRRAGFTRLHGDVAALWSGTGARGKTKATKATNPYGLFRYCSCAAAAVSSILLTEMLVDERELLSEQQHPSVVLVARIVPGRNVAYLLQQIHQRAAPAEAHPRSVCGCRLLGPT